MNYGLSIPIPGTSLREQSRYLDAAAAAGFTDLWSSESNGADAFTPLAAAAVSHPLFRLGTAIVPAFTRAPGVLTMSAAALADLAQSQVLLGIGASSDVIVNKWNGVPFEDPYGRTRDVVTFVKRALTGERVDLQTPSFQIDGFRLERVPERPPAVLVAALRPGMLRLAGRHADGAILNWLSASDVTKVVPYVHEGRSEPPEIVARLFVIPSTDTLLVRAHAKRQIAAYLNVNVYAKYHAWLGRSSQLEPMWSAWAAGDRKAALKAIPDSLVDELFVHGDSETCRARIDEYVANGITTPMLAITDLDSDPYDSITRLGPSPTASAK
ncbi:MAG: LLM class F420-dependent oxidoreductase [Antricoccus sp.]